MFAILAAALFLSNVVVTENVTGKVVITPQKKVIGKTSTRSTTLTLSTGYSASNLLYSNTWGSSGSGGSLTLQGGSAGGAWTYAMRDDQVIGKVTLGQARGGDVRISGGSGTPAGSVLLITDGLDRVWLSSDGVLHYNGSQVATLADLEERMNRGLLRLFFTIIGAIMAGSTIVGLWKRYYYNRWWKKQVSADEGPYRSSGNPR